MHVRSWKNSKDYFWADVFHRPLILILFIVLLLNQACAGHRPARAWFLEIVCVWTSVCVCMCVCVFVCVSAPEAISN